MACQVSTQTKSCENNSGKKIIMPPTYFAALLALEIGAFFIFPVKTLINGPVTYLGILLIGFGIILEIWSSALFNKRKTTISPLGVPTALMAEGPFRISRNPIYLGMLAILIGAAIFLGVIAPFAFPIVFFLIIEVTFIPMEEKKMEDVFGNDYRNYKRTVRRWV